MLSRTGRLDHVLRDSWRNHFADLAYDSKSDRDRQQRGTVWIEADKLQHALGMSMATERGRCLVSGVGDKLTTPKYGSGNGQQLLPPSI